MTVYQSCQYEPPGNLMVDVLRYSKLMFKGLLTEMCCYNMIKYNLCRIHTVRFSQSSYRCSSHTTRLSGVTSHNESGHTIIHEQTPMKKNLNNIQVDRNKTIVWRM